MKPLLIEQLPLEALKPYEKNARKHAEKDITAIVASIEEFGFNDPIGIWGPDNIIVEGHGRLEAAKKLGMKAVPCIRLDHLSDEQRRAYALAHNKTAELSEWDLQILPEELGGIFDVDMSEFGFDMTAIEGAEESELEEVDIPEEVETRCQLGDLYQLGDHRLMCGDSTDAASIKRLMGGAMVDLLLTDPPYEMDAEGGGILKSANSMKQIIENGVDSFDPSCLTLWCKTNIFFHNKPLIKSYIELAEVNKKPYDLAFYKKNNSVPNYGGHLMTDVEYIAIIGNQDPNKGLSKEMYSKCYEGQKDSDNELSYSKPVALNSKFIQLYSQNSVLDLYGGSGSTLIACEQLGRKCYMMELDPHFCDVIIQRWENFTGRKAELL